MIQYDENLEHHKEALLKTAEFYRNNAIDVRIEDHYADHVSESEKNEILENRLSYADEVQHAKHMQCFAVAQRFHFYLTGEYIALLP